MSEIKTATRPAPKSTKQAPAAMKQPETRRFAVVRVIPRGASIDPAAKITVLVEANTKLPSAKNHAYFQALMDGAKDGLTVGEIAAKHKDLPIIAEVRHAFERAFIDLAPAPATTPAKT
jgi:hypothetical protein